MTTSDAKSDQSQAGLLQGAGSHDLATDSSDPNELRAMLARARERLSFYEGFDRLIAENVRRSGELMLESLTIRESVVGEASRRDDHVRTQVAASLDGFGADLANVRSHLDSLDAQLRDLRQALSLHVEPSVPTPVQSPAEDAPGAIDAPSETEGETWDAPRTVEVIAHGVNKAATALSIQRFLGDLTAVAGVEAREFAEGVLRLQVTAQAPLQRDDLATWAGNGSMTILQFEPSVIELELT